MKQEKTTRSTVSKGKKEVAEETVKEVVEDQATTRIAMDATSGKGHLTILKSIEITAHAQDPAESADRAYAALARAIANQDKLAKLVEAEKAKQNGSVQ